MGSLGKRGATIDCGLSAIVTTVPIALGRGVDWFATVPGDT